MSSRRHWSDRVRDILDALQEIRTFTAQLNFEQFQADLKTIRAVEMNLIVIGEAAARFPRRCKSRIRLCRGTLCAACATG